MWLVVTDLPGQRELKLSVPTLDSSSMEEVRGLSAQRKHVGLPPALMTGIATYPPPARWAAEP